jgi:hypothetical protein
MLVRVSRFGAEHAASFPSETLAARSFAAVAEVASALEHHAVVQASVRSRERPRLKAAARKRLRDSLCVVSRTARALAIDTPQLVGKFRVPKTNGDHALLIAARVIVCDARELAAEFVAHGLSQTFLTDVDTQTKALERATGEYGTQKQAGVAATAGIGAMFAQGHAAVRRLDAIVANVFNDNQSALAAWQLARRVGRNGRSLPQERIAPPVPRTLLTSVA